MSSKPPVALDTSSGELTGYPARVGGEPAPPARRRQVSDDRTWLLRAWQWRRRLNWVHLVGIVLTITGAIEWPNTMSAANLARELQATGTPVTVQLSEVLLAESFQRGGDKVETVKARVLIPGSRDKVELHGIDPPFGQPLTAAFAPGWTAATTGTGYAAPLEVRYVHKDGDTTAMAQSDIVGAVERDDGVFGWVLLIGLALFVLGFLPRLRRRSASLR